MVSILKYPVGHTVYQMRDRKSPLTHGLTDLGPHMCGIELLSPTSVHV